MHYYFQGYELYQSYQLCLLKDQQDLAYDLYRQRIRSDYRASSAIQRRIVNQLRKTISRIGDGLVTVGHYLQMPDVAKPVV